MGKSRVISVLVVLAFISLFSYVCLTATTKSPHASLDCQDRPNTHKLMKMVYGACLSMDGNDEKCSIDASILACEPRFYYKICIQIPALEKPVYCHTEEFLCQSEEVCKEMIKSYNEEFDNVYQLYKAFFAKKVEI